MRIFIACTDDKLRLALHIFLDDQPGMAVVGISDRFKGLFTQLKGAEPTVLLLDWAAPSHEIVDLLARLDQLEYRPQVLLSILDYLTGNSKMELEKKD